MITWKLKRLPIDFLQPYDKNPRSLSESQRLHLSDSIDRFGIIDKPVVNIDGTIIGGHQRVEVLGLKGETDVECWLPDRELSEKEVEECNIRLNRGGQFDFDILANSFEVFDLLNWGFDEYELGLDKPEKKAKKEKFVVSLEFMDKESMIENLQFCEEIAQKTSAKMKVRG